MLPQRHAQLETMQFMLQPAADTVSPTMTLHVGTDTVHHRHSAVAVRYGQRLYDMIVWLECITCTVNQCNLIKCLLEHDRTMFSICGDSLSKMFLHNELIAISVWGCMYILVFTQCHHYMATWTDKWSNCKSYLLHCYFPQSIHGHNIKSASSPKPGELHDKTICLLRGIHYLWEITVVCSMSYKTYP